MLKIRCSLLLVALCAVAAPSFAEDKLPNPKCPLMVEDDAEEDIKVSYQGKDIFLCCGSCAKQWNKDPDYYAALSRELKMTPQLADVKIPESVQLLEQRFCPFSTKRLVGPSSPSAEYRGVKIYFSKPGHLRTWNEDPDRYAKECFEKGLLPQLKGKI